MKNVVTLKTSPYKVHHELLGQIYYQRSCPVPCGNECCDEGNFIEAELIKSILQEQGEIKKLLRRNVKEGRWFDTGQGLFIDDDLPHQPLYLATKVYQNDSIKERHSCAFLDSSGYCALQKYSETTSPDQWRLKPLYCWLYPLIIRKGIVRLARSQDLERPFPIREKCLKRVSKSIRGLELFEPELRYLLKDGYEELKEHAKKGIEG